MSEPSSQDLKDLARVRARDCEMLLAARRYSGAYYLAGYAIECAVKAVIALSFRAHVIPSRALVNDVHTHDLNRLIRLAGLWEPLQQHSADSAEFKANWARIVAWSEASRYEIIDEFRAFDIVGAVNDPTHGVLQWLMKHW